jgi:hypothetical protein
LAKIQEPGVRLRAERCYQQLDLLQPVRQEARRQLLLESRKHPGVKLLRQIPSISPIRAALLVVQRRCDLGERSPRPLYDFYVSLLEKGMRPTMARLTLARKIAAITLIMWKKGVDFDPKQLHRQAA